MNRLIHAIIKWPKTTIVLFLLISVPFGYAFLQKTFLNNVKLFFEKDDPIIAAYEKFQETYGNEEIAIIVIHAEELFTNKMLGIVREISGMAKASEGIQRVFSLTEATEPIGREDSITFAPIVPKGTLDAARLRELKEYVLNRELTTETLIAKDGRSTVVVLELASIASTEKKGEVLNHIEAQTRKIVGQEATLYFSGAPFVEHEINALTQRDDKTFTPILVSLILLLALVSIKRVSLSILCLANLLLTMLWIMGGFIMAGNLMNLVTVLLPPMILTIAMADTIHILIHFNTLYSTMGRSRLDAVFETVSNLWFPCLFTSLTNAIGFLSFMTTPVSPLRTLGLYGALGSMLECFMAITLLPALIVVFVKNPTIARPVHPSRLGKSLWQWLDIGRLLQGIRQVTLRHPWPVVIVFVLLIIASTFGAARMRYETNFANHLGESDPIKQGIRFIEKNLFGTVPIALLIRAKTADRDFTHPESLKLIDTIQNGLKKEFEGESTSFFSITDYFKEIHRAFNQGRNDFYRIPDDRVAILDYYELGETEILKRLVAADRMEIRIAFNVYLGPIRHNRQFENYLDTLLKDQSAHFSYEITGASTLFVAMDRKLKESLLNSFTSAFLMIFFMIHLICKNWKLTLITIPPNLFPILVTFGIMGFFDIPLDNATVMIASITMGIAVDDTVHFVVWFRRFALEGMETKEALLSTYKHTGKEMLTTAFILCLAFLALLAGSIIPTRSFGALTCMALFFGILAEIFLLPAMVLLIKPNIRKKEARLEAYATSGEHGVSQKRA